MKRTPAPIGQRFHRLTVIGEAPTQKAESYVRCRCNCGVETVKNLYSVTSGNTTSCGCAAREHAATMRAKHFERHPSNRQTETPEYKSWQSIKTRCLNRHSTYFRNYGGRGITVCEQWRQSFQAFLRDVGRRPTPKHTLERIDNDGPYSPENCTWATRRQQANNRRSNIQINWNGKRQSLQQWCEELGLPPSLISQRLRHHWSAQRAFTTKLQIHRPNGHQGVTHPGSPW